MLNDAVQGVIPALATYLLANMDDVRAALESAGASTSGLDKIPLLLEPCKALWQIENARTNDEGTIVVLMGDNYMLIPDKNPTLPEIKTASQLDAGMAGKIGILKVFDKNDEALEDVGIRLNATTFYILP